MTAQEACRAAAQAIRDISANLATVVVECPLSDGGEGLVDCVEQPLPQPSQVGRKMLERVHLRAHDPLMNIIDACYLCDYASKTAYMEMAATSGLTLVPEDKRNPMITTTYGVGEMIADATRRGCRHIVMGIGGSATCDAGKGMLKAIEDSALSVGDLPQITVACDVRNPLYGIDGAAYVFAPQKGATEEQVQLLDEQLRAFARETEKSGLATKDQACHPGAGAAGGLGYALMVYLKADLRPGIEIILDIKDFDRLIKDADLVITGEGKSDEQTMMGKVPCGVLQRARQENIPVWLLSGGIDDKDGILSQNFDLVKSINSGDSRPLEVLMNASVAKDNLRTSLQSLLQ